jgi:hypothetical protein
MSTSDWIQLAIVGVVAYFIINKNSSAPVPIAPAAKIPTQNLCAFGLTNNNWCG